MLTIMSRKAYGFRNPTASIAPTDPDKQKTTQNFAEAFVQVHPSGSFGAYGNPTQVPDWVEHDGMFKLAVADSDIVVLQGLPELKTEEQRAAEAAKQSTLAAARQGSSDSVFPPDYSKMSKAELVDHAATVHGLELDLKDKHADLVAAIEEKVTAPAQ
jgi:hypothetical protein